MRGRDFRSKLCSGKHTRLLLISSLGLVGAQGCLSNNVEQAQELISEVKVCNDLSVKALLAEGADASTRSEQGETPIVFAARSNCIDSVRHLLEAGADPMAEVDSRETPLYYAAVHGNTEIVELLLKAGVAVDTKTEDGWTPLMAAAALGHVGTVQYLLEAGAAREMKNYAGQSSLDLVSYCIEPGWDVTHLPDNKPFYFGHRPRRVCHKEVQAVLSQSDTAEGQFVDA